jgi:hypothetical protein
MMKDIEELLFLVNDGAKGIDHIDLGAIGFNGYGFAFRNPFSPKVSFVTLNGSSKFCTLSLLLKRNIFQGEFDSVARKVLHEYMMEKENYSLLLTGSLKTLVPTLKFGGDEMLFFAWMFVRTPDGKQFPATFYHGQSGMSLGGWKSPKDNIFPPAFISVINFNPFNFPENEIEDLGQALEHALRTTPISDFYGVYKHDFGQTLMGVQNGKPFTMELRRPMDDIEVQRLINSRVF